MPILVDGNNLLHTLPRSSRNRDGVRRLVLEQTRGERVTVTVVFDGFAEAGAPPREFLGQVRLEYAGASSADDAIITRIPSGPSAQSWVVVTDDRGLARRARNRGAAVRSVAEWMSRRGARRPDQSRRTARPLNADEVADWERFFAAGPDPEPEDHNRS